MIEYIKAFIYGVLEGVTEWLPISSTGHLILLGEWIPLKVSDNADFNTHFVEMFNIFIQLGAVLAVVILFWNTLWPFTGKKSRGEIVGTFRLWLKMIIASIPAAIVGFAVDGLVERFTGKTIDGWLYNAGVVAAMLIVYGVLFIAVERANRNKPPKIDGIDGISNKTALIIGCFQSASIIPGTSRSGSTILGSISIGVSRVAAAEFCFILGIPVIVGKGGFKLLRYLMYLSDTGISAPMQSWIVLAIGFTVAFTVSLVSVKFLMGYVKKHSFAAFGIYRIILGVAVLINFLLVR